ncbi:MAG TPA: alpha/beta family hydrolase [Streptosporangiaceae bacterium]|nr:alpha/beta family hydrolase [Streptosporangiaceae bacterium]
MEIITAGGPALAELAGPPGRDAGPGGAPGPAFLLVLTHGSGGRVATPDVLAVRDAGLRLGGLVALVTQPYRVQGRRAPGNAERQDAAWVEVIGALRAATAGPGIPLIQGGRSNGARVACRTAGPAGARGVIALAFPLHPPGRPDRSRAAELAGAGTDVLVINGRNDPFGIPRRAAGRRVVVLDGETHALSRHPDAAGRAATSWLRKLLG